MQSLLAPVVLATLRYGPLFVLAPPFSRVPVPMAVRAWLVLALALLTVDGHAPGAFDGAAFVAAATAELALGLLIAFALQATFASLAFAGRVIDIQAGYGLAMVIDPATRTQTPLLGSIFTLVGGAVFFAAGGHLTLFALLGHLDRLLPLGQAQVWLHPAGVIGVLSSAMALGISLAGGTMLVLLVVDVAIAYLSRVLPQMNAMMLGFQVKAALTLMMLALSAPLLATVLFRVLANALTAITVVALP